MLKWWNMIAHMISRTKLFMISAMTYFQVLVGVYFHSAWFCFLVYLDATGKWLLLFILLCYIYYTNECNCEIYWFDGTNRVTKFHWIYCKKLIFQKTLFSQGCSSDFIHMILLCCLQSIATHRDHFVRWLSVLDSRYLGNCCLQPSTLGISFQYLLHYSRTII